MKRNIKLFFDMDGTIANINDKDTSFQQLILSKGYFENLKPLPFLEEVNKIAALFPENVFILSACCDSEYCKEEKIKWLKKYLPFATKYNVIFTKVGDNKGREVEKRLGSKIDPYFILIDDYSKNIYDWENAGGTSLKFVNGGNNTSGKKYKYTIRDFNDLMDVVAIIRSENEK